MLQTTNYSLKKIELTDTPPDITVINPNWDTIDTQLKSLNDAKVSTSTTDQYLTGDHTWKDFFTSVRAATLTGLSTATNAVIAATDTILSALGKLQKQITDLTTTVSAKAPITSPNLLGSPTAPNPAVSDNTTAIATTAWVIGQRSTATPLMSGSAAIGSAFRWAREDHVHPSDTTRAPLASPTFTGTPYATPGTDYTTSRLRNIALSTTASSPANGDLLGVYS